MGHTTSRLFSLTHSLTLPTIRYEGANDGEALVVSLLGAQAQALALAQDDFLGDQYAQSTVHTQYIQYGTVKRIGQRIVRAEAL